MLAPRLTTILPAMSLAEALETTRIHRVAGRTGGRTAVATTRPFHGDLCYAIGMSTGNGIYCYTVREKGVPETPPRGRPGSPCVRGLSRTAHDVRALEQSPVAAHQRHRGHEARGVTTAFPHSRV
jgi:Magnesium chelatase, subunit ChlI